MQNGTLVSSHFLERGHTFPAAEGPESAQLLTGKLQLPERVSLGAPETVLQEAANSRLPRALSVAFSLSLSVAEHPQHTPALPGCPPPPLPPPSTCFPLPGLLMVLTAVASEIFALVWLL